MKVLVVGAGMYVTGRHGTGAGTVMAALAQASRTMPIDEVLVVARDPGNAALVTEAAARVNQLLGSSLAFRYQVIDGDRRLDQQLSLADFACSIVVVPDHLHFRYTAELLEARVPPLVVKPLVPTVAEARKLIEIQDRTDTYAAVEFHKRWDESNLMTRRYIAENRLGPLVYAVVDYSQRIRIPTEVFKGWADRTNIFQYLGVHYVDLLYFLTGLTPLRAMAVGTRGVLTSRGVNTYDSVHAQVLWGKPGDAEHRFVSLLSINWIDPNTTSALSDQKMKVICGEGRIELDQKDRGIEVVTNRDGIQHVNPYFADYLPSDSGSLDFQGYGYKSIAAFFADVLALQAGKTTRAKLEPLRPTLRQSLVSVAIVEAVNESLAHGSEWRTIDASL
ncbi:MAG TPA: Gfo/Idh/MocA family oxidoreductase [Kofleriaceae bacterium]|nr:Gfo/Idh/MocA family oxidoreductase [Kofleriaceae bacterium]